MKKGVQVAWLPDGKRLHLGHGPIDLVIEIWGAGRFDAYAAAAARFETVLQELVAELPQLKAGARHESQFDGDIAQSMQRAAAAFLPAFVTPMAAVAGAVADEIARVIGETHGVDKAYVNNGGDVSLVLSDGEVLTADVGGGIARMDIHGAGCVGGVATSGWRGRSLSFGIADAVTVLASTAAKADVAATMIANEVDLPGHPGISRAMADSRQIDSDLGSRLVTVSVPELTREEIQQALRSGVDFAAGLQPSHGVWAGLICLQGHVATFGDPSLRKAALKSCRPQLLLS